MGTIQARVRGSDTADGLLLQWLAAYPDDEARQLLDVLFSTHVKPWCALITRRVLRTYAHRDADFEEEASEIEAEVLLQIATRLATLRNKSPEATPPLRDLRAYLVSCVYNACFGRLRAQSPRRFQTQNRVRYLLRNDDRFALWTAREGELIAGFARWRDREDYCTVPFERPGMCELDRLLERVFQTARKPLLFDALVGLVSEILGIVDSAPVSLSAREDTPAPYRPQDDVLIAEQNLVQVWGEIANLPPNQRSALLLNLRAADGHGVIELIPATGAGSFDAIAQVLGISPDELSSIWNDLPMDDARIAERLGVTRQQVINLRKSARERLARRYRVADANIGAKPASTGSTQVFRNAGRAAKKLLVAASRGDR